MLETSGIELAAVHFALSPDRIVAALAQAEAQGITVALAAGGDGTVGTVAGHVLRTNFTLGVLPAGTSNDFARSLRIPISVEGSVDVVARGRTVNVDVGAIGDRVFVHTATVGINCDFARQAETLRKYLGRMSYPIASMIVYRTRRRFPVRIASESETYEFEAFEVAVINSPVYGGPLELEAPDSTLTDRRLSVVVAEDLRFRTILKGTLLSYRHKRIKLKGITTLTASNVVIETETPMSVSADGEICASTPLTVRVLPLALRVFASDRFFQTEYGLH